MPPRLPALIFAAGLAAWICSAAIGWLGGAPLGHDEAQYALAGRDLIAGEAPRWFYASSGMSVVAAIGEALGDGERALRLPAVLLGIGFVLAAGGLAWRVSGAATAAWVVAVLAGMRSLARLSAELLSDLPAAALLLAGTAVIVGELGRRDADGRPAGARWRVLAAAPLLAGALYLRYASSVPIAIVGAAALAVWPRSILRRPAPVLALIGLVLALLVPHARAAIAETGSPLGILLASKDVPYRTWFGEGLATYVAANPVTYYGLLAAPVLLAGLAAVAIRGPGGPGPAADRRPMVMLWLVAVGHIVAIGLISHAQARYICFGTTLLVVLGVDVLRRLVAARSPRVRRVLGVAAALAIAASWGTTAVSQSRVAPHQRRSLDKILAAAAAMKRDAAGARCQVVGDQYTQLEWYSGCRSSTWPWDDLDRGDVVYVVRRPGDAPVPTRGVARPILGRDGGRGSPDRDRSDISVTRYDR